MCSLLNMQFIMFNWHVDVFTFEHAVHNVHMRVQKWTSIHMLHGMVHIVILALIYTKTLKILMWTYAHYNVAMIRHITCSFSAANVRKMKKNTKFRMLPVQILYSMFEPLLAWIWCLKLQNVWMNFQWKHILYNSDFFSQHVGSHRRKININIAWNSRQKLNAFYHMWDNNVCDSNMWQ